MIPRRVAALLVFVVAVGAVLAGAPPAAAHATLQSSDPAEGAVLAEAPDVVTFTFDEAVRLAADPVSVFDAEGQPVESSTTARDKVVTTDLPDDLDHGTYVVVWQVVSADGHPIAGSLTFSIGTPSLEVAAPAVRAADTGPVRTALSIVQAGQYLGLLTAAGLLFFLAWTLAGVRIDDAVGARVLTVARGATGLAVTGAVLAVPLSGAYQQRFSLSDIADPRVLDLGLVRGEVLVAVLIAAGLTLAALGVRRPERRALTLAGAAAAALAPALVGHSRAIDPVWLMTVTDVLHLLAGSVWLGGLVGLVLVLGALSGRERDAALVLSRFSTVAAGLLGLLALTGVLMGWRILEAWSPLVQTGYGRVLLVKAGVAGLVALVAGYNRFRVLPRAVDGVGHDTRRAGVLGVRHAVRIEAGLLVVVLGLTGFLTNLSPREAPVNRQPVPSRVDAALAGEVKVLVAASPARRGPNTLYVQLQNAAGEPLDVFAEPEVSLSSMPDGDAAPVDLGEQPVTPVATGTFSAQVVLPAAGTWRVQVSVRASEFENPVAVVEVEVS